MIEAECEQIARRAGFLVSVGNWISPDGTLIFGKNYKSHHWETIQEYLGETPETDNYLAWMNDKVLEGFIRLVFRHNVFFQVDIKEYEDLWGDAPNIVRLREILEKLAEIEIHIFGKTFYLIALAQDILGRNMHIMQIKEN